jgi:hypothetical protein
MTKTYLVQEVHWDRRRRRWTEWDLIYGIAFTSKREAVVSLGDFAFDLREYLNAERDWFVCGHSVLVRILEVCTPAATCNYGTRETPSVSILLERRITKKVKK